jgi:RNA polymerase sigma-70 factor (ECF subfamily)
MPVIKARTFVGAEVSKLVRWAESRLQPDVKGASDTDRSETGPIPPDEPREPIRDREEDEDWEIVREVKEGRTERFSVLVRKHQDRIFSVVLRILQSQLDAEEITNDAFVTAYRKIGSFRGDARFSSWLHRIATNLSINRLRKARSRDKTTSLDEIIETVGKHTGEPAADPGDSPVRQAEESEWIGLIERSLGEIPGELRAVIVLRDVEGLKYEEIASRIDVPLGTVKSRLHKGRALLQGMLRKYR